MATANPKCEHCSKPMVFIGIGPGAEPIRVCECESGPPCTTCGSRHTEPFVTWSYNYWSGTREEHDNGTYRCITHGHVFTPRNP